MICPWVTLVFTGWVVMLISCAFVCPLIGPFTVTLEFTGILIVPTGPDTPAVSTPAPILLRLAWPVADLLAVTIAVLLIVILPLPPLVGVVDAPPPIPAPTSGPTPPAVAITVALPLIFMCLLHPYHRRRFLLHKCLLWHSQCRH